MEKTREGLTGKHKYYQYMENCFVICRVYYIFEELIPNGGNKFKVWFVDLGTVVF